MTPAAGIRVLLVEDEPIVAILAEDFLESIGCTVVATAASVAEAQAAIGTCDFDVAMLDLNLDGEDGLVVAALLKARGIPFFITTGYDAGGLSTGYAAAPMLTKPYAIADLERAICRCMGRA